MNRLIPVFLMLIFMSVSVYADDFQDGVKAFKREDYKTAFEKWRTLRTLWINNYLWLALLFWFVWF